MTEPRLTDCPKNVAGLEENVPRIITCILICKLSEEGSLSILSMEPHHEFVDTEMKSMFGFCVPDGHLNN